MRKLIILVTITLAVNFCAQAQSKKDLIARINELKSEISESANKLAESQKNERVAATKIETLESQMESLEETNTSILSKMGSFTELSQKKAQNLETSLETIKKKDEQLNTIDEALTKADSTKLATFSLFKNALGGVGEKEVKLSLNNGAVIIDIPNGFLFQSTNSDAITDNAKTLVLAKIAQVLNAKTDLKFQIEGNSNEISFANGAKDNWDLSSMQSAAIVRTLQTEFTVEPKRMLVVGKGQYSTDLVETKSTIKILPDYEGFYKTVKESMKE